MLKRLYKSSKNKNRKRRRSAKLKMKHSVSLSKNSRLREQWRMRLFKKLMRIKSKERPMKLRPN